jgi:putative tryptophan/tyrosine transport system substrate-binding protein
MRRREFITLVGGAAATWPLAARAQQPATPVIGFLGTGSAESDLPRLTALRKGLNEADYVEGQNFAIEFRWADGQYDRLPRLAAELVSRPVAVLVAGALPATLAAKAATSTTPIVFANGNDPVKFGLVASLNRPGGNITGVSFLSNALAEKQLDLLREVVPQAVLLGLQNPNNPNAEIDTQAVENAASSFGIKVLMVKASTPAGIDEAFATFVKQQIGALVIHADAFFASRYEQLAFLVTRYAIPATFYLREFVAAGGLMSYSASITDGYRQAGIYVSRILKGERPADLPVQQAVKVELVINLRTARAFGLTVPLPLLGRADEVIE